MTGEGERTKRDRPRPRWVEARAHSVSPACCRRTERACPPPRGGGQTAGVAGSVPVIRGTGAGEARAATRTVTEDWMRSTIVGLMLAATLAWSGGALADTSTKLVGDQSGTPFSAE